MQKQVIHPINNLCKVSTKMPQRRRKARAEGPSMVESEYPTHFRTTKEKVCTLALQDVFA